ncbi:MAG: hypothetical protein ABSA46_14945 [Thermodesulfovibrionales bacterium]|jgi:hypothetical protein
MKNEYYGDKRDLVKWGTLVHLCQAHKLHTVIQVAFFRQKDTLPTLSSTQGTFKLHNAVWEHFRNIRKIKELRILGINVIDHIFNPTNRSAYTKHVISVIEGIKSPGRLVCLDPDTGIAPTNVKSEHVTEEEIKKYWDVIDKGDCLVLYQHARHVHDWQSLCKNQFMEACDISEAETYNCPEIAHDVAFFAALK